MKKNYLSPEYKITVFSGRDTLVTSIEFIPDHNGGSGGSGEIVVVPGEGGLE